MIRHNLRELRELCTYRIAGIGAEGGTLTGLVFDAADRHLRSFVIGHNMPLRKLVEIPASFFSSLDDDRRELQFRIEAGLLQSAEEYQSSTPSERNQFDAVALIGRTINGRDGTAGQISDMLLNVEFWLLRYFVIDMADRRVLTDIEWASSLTEGQSSLHLDLPARAIVTAPAYEGLSELRQGDEEELYRHYTRATFASSSAVIRATSTDQEIS